MEFAALYIQNPNLESVFIKMPLMWADAVLDRMSSEAQTQHEIWGDIGLWGNLLDSHTIREDKDGVIWTYTIKGDDWSSEVVEEVRRWVAHKKSTWFSFMQKFNGRRRVKEDDAQKSLEHVKREWNRKRGWW